MAYAQTNYSEKVGNGPYSIAEIGCFITSFCNLLERFGDNVDPETLNAYFIKDNDYLADPADGAGVKDNVGWSTITAYKSSVTVGSIGSGWPSSNNAIVKFHYRSISEPTLPNGQPNMVDHFCLVADAAAHTIVDSWDGKTKSPGAYGEPVAYATYVNTVPQPVTPAVPAAPSHPYTVEKITPKQMTANSDPSHLWDLDATTWPAFKSLKDYAKGTEVTIVAIATHNLGSKYYMLNADEPQGFNVVDLVDYVPPAPTPPAPAAAPAVSTPPVANPFTKFEGPKTLLTNKQPTSIWNLTAKTWTSFVATSHLEEGSPFTAVGQYKHPLGGVYYMDAASFGSADQSGTPAAWNGINDVDLSPVPSPSVANSVSTAAKVDVAATTLETAAPAVPAPGKVVSPSVATTSPSTSQDQSYKSTFEPLVKPLIALKSVLIKDLDGIEKEKPLVAGKLIAQAGTFWKDDKKYILTIQSEAENIWRGIPAELGASVPTHLRKKAEAMVEDIYDKYHHDIEDELDQLFHEGMKFDDEIANEAITIVDKHEKHVNEVAKVLSFLHLNKNK